MLLGLGPDPEGAAEAIPGLVEFSWGSPKIENEEEDLIQRQVEIEHPL